MSDKKVKQLQKEELSKFTLKKNPVLVKNLDKKQISKKKIEKKSLFKDLEEKIEVLDQGIISEVEYQSNKAFLDEGNLLEQDNSLNDLEDDIKKVEFGKFR